MSAPSSPSPDAGSETRPCDKCGGWTQNADGHRDDCPTRAKPERSSDAIMLLVWEQWAKKEGNAGAAALFRRAADALPPVSSPASERRGEPMTEEDVAEYVATEHAGYLTLGSQELLREVVRLRSERCRACGATNADADEMIASDKRRSGSANRANGTPSVGTSETAPAADRGGETCPSCGWIEGHADYCYTRASGEPSPDLAALAMPAEPCGKCPTCAAGHGAWCPDRKQRESERLRALASLQAEQERAARTIRHAAHLMSSRMEGATVDDSFIAAYRVLFEHLYPGATLRGEPTPFQQRMNAARSEEIGKEIGVPTETWPAAPTTTETKDAR